ncbi:MAG: tryptophan-rich sensory protein [Novosphingobium sp.]|nr:tryptophan-rich sensory protein [Novosphingobium sp.]
MTLLASRGQLRAGFLRWALVLVPGVLLLGLLSAALSRSGPGNPWFDALQKPAIYPPPEVFGIVWSVLYMLMALALAQVVVARGARLRRAAIALFLIQLVLNLAWSPLFFAAHQIAAALVLLIILDVAVAITTVVFFRVRPAAGALFVPYLAWVAFATVLNLQFLTANPNAATGGAGAPAVRMQL